MPAQAARGVLSGALAVLLSLWAVPAYAADVEKIGDVEGDSAYGQAASDDNVTQFDEQASPVGAPGQDALSPSDPAVPEDPAAALGEGSPAEPAPEASVPAAQREGLVEEGGALYFYEGGRRVSGERQIDGSWYYFDPEDGGAAVRSGFAEIPDANLPAEWEGSKECYYDEDGRMVKGELCLDGDWYFLDPGSGAKSYGFALLDDPGVQGGRKWCYYGPFKGDGRMVKGEACVDGKWYYLDPGSGGVTYGFALLDDPGVEGGRKWVYYGPFMADGTMRYGEQCIDGGWYYLTPGSGAVDYEWALIPDGAGGSKWVYYGPYMGDGRMRYGYQNVGDGWCNFNHTTGEVSYGMSYVTELGIWRYFDKGTGRWTADMKIRDWLGSSGGAYPSLAGCRNINVQVDLKNQVVLIREGSAVLYAMICSTGVNDCTPHGDFRVTGRGYSFYNSREGMGARYYVQFLGDYLFHSVPTDSSGNYIAGEGEKLGRPASHGCVRLTVSDAKWLYGNLPNGASVHIG